MHNRQGFTLIELSIVLVIIGLLAGGILVGRDLIDAAKVRSQISQLEKLHTAVNTFRIKYGGIPGDLREDHALANGMVSGAGIPLGPYSPIPRNDNGILETCGDGGDSTNAVCGETAFFWNDLSVAGLIEGSFSNEGLQTSMPGCCADANVDLNRYFPVGKIGNNNSLAVYGLDGINYYSLANFTMERGAGPMGGSSLYGVKPAITAIQAYNIDQKIDDGKPQTGKVFSGKSTDLEAIPGPANACLLQGAGPIEDRTYNLAGDAGNNYQCIMNFQFQ